MKAIGRHVILEMWGCQNLESVETAERALREMVVALDVNLLDLRVYPFSPVGVTGVTAGKRYRCTVVATNSRGTGPRSVPSAPVTA